MVIGSPLGRYYLKPFFYLLQEELFKKIAMRFFALFLLALTLFDSPGNLEAFLSTIYNWQ